MDGCRFTQDATEQRKEGGLGFLLVAELVAFGLVRMAAGERAVPVVQVAAVPRDAMALQPRDAELGLQTLAEIAFALWVSVDAVFDHGNGHVVGEGSCDAKGVVMD